MEEPPGRHKWGVLENKWRFFQPLYFNPTSNYLLEFLIFIHIYILAALLAIREALFDSRNKAKILLLAHQLKSHRFDVAFFAPGIMLSPENRTSDGVELHNAVNVVGQAMLYELIQNECKRAIFLSSATARVACYSKDPNFLSVYAGPYQAYASSKLNLAVYVKEVAKDRQVTAVSLHPGTVPGHLYKNANYLVRYLNATLLPKLMRSPEMAALVVLHTIFRDDIQPGAYYEDMETVNVADWVPEEERTRIYETIHRRIDLWMEK
uniref:Epimerase domain-containing protein n=1 Tax=Caenorhabditis tropicalis TaxID=1561998 RepID=A0A1I7TDJ6_9PELO